MRWYSFRSLLFFLISSTSSLGVELSILFVMVCVAFSHDSVICSSSVESASSNSSGVSLGEVEGLSNS